MHKRYPILAIFSGIFIGFSLVIMSLVTKTVHPFVYASISDAVAIPILFFVSLFFGGRGFKDIVIGKKKEFTTIFIERTIIGGLLLVFGISMSLAIRSVFIVQVEPALVFVLSVLLLKERIRKSKIFLLSTLVLGAFLLIAGGDIGIFQSVLLGDLLVISAMIFFAHSYLVSAKVMKSANAVRLQTAFLIIGMPIFILLALLTQPVGAFLVGWENLMLILAASILFNVIGFPLWLVSLKRLRPWVVSSMIMVQSVSGAVLSFFWLGQTLSIVQIVGGIVILISVYFISLKG